MDAHRLTRRDRRTLLICIAAGALGSALFAGLYSRAFPAASVTIAIDREEALRVSREYLESLGHDIEPYRHAVDFQSRRTTLTFLEKELGRGRSAALIAGGIDIWLWRCRWFIPSREEEFLVFVTPQGRPAAHRHRIPEAAQGAGLSGADALDLAQAFLAEYSPSDLSLFELKANSETERPNRVDHVLRWERPDEDLAGAKRRISIGVQGGAIGSYSETLDIPETWIRDELRKRARRGLLMTAASTAKDGMLLLVFVVFVFNLRRWNMRFRFAIVLGAVLGILELLGWANALPLIWMGYNTNETVTAFFGSRLVGLAANVTNIVFSTIIVGAVGDALARETLPSRLSLSHLLTRGFWTSKELFIGAAAGCALALVHAAYVAAFYVSGEYVGVWSPIAPPYENSLATPLPWLLPLTVGLSASISEEFLFRLFGIAFLLRFAKNKAVAILLPAIVWGFLHSNYSQDPEYTRGIELTIAGVAYGAVFLRYGIVATLVSHYAYNALVSSVILLQSETPYLRLSGVAAIGLMAAPLLPGFWVLLTRRPFGEIRAEDQAPMDPSPILPPERPAGIQPETAYGPLTLRVYAALAVAAAAGIGYCAYDDRERFGDYLSIETNRVEAESIAREFLEEQGVDLEGYRAVTEFRRHFSGAGADFLYQQIGAGALNETFSLHLPSAAVWTADFFVPLQVESYRVVILPEGEVFGYRRYVEEDAPGAKPDEDEALAVAEAFLRAKGLDLSKYRLVDSIEREEKNRTDHAFIWERAGMALGRGSLRISMTVQGGEATVYNAYVDVPDEWARTRAESRIGDVVLAAFGGLLLIAATAGLGAVFVSFFLSGGFRWALGIRAGALAGLLFAIHFANGYPAFWNAYATESEPFVYAGTVLIRQVSYLFLVMGGAAIAAAYAEALFRRAFPAHVQTKDWFIPAPPESRQPARRRGLLRGWGEALIVGALLACAAQGLNSMITPALEDGPAAAAEMDIHETAPAPRGIPRLDSRWPALEIGVEALFASAAVVAASIILLGFYYSFVRQPRLVWSILAALVLAAGWADSATLAEFVLDAPLNILAFAAIGLLLYFLIRGIIRDNIPTALAALLMSQMLQSGLALASLPDDFLAGQGYILVGIVCAAGPAGVALLWISRKTPAVDKMQASNI